MFINELPDDCLLTIFGFINELDDLMECYKVCAKWCHLIVKRTRKVKYLVEHQDYGSGYVAYSTAKPNDESHSLKIPNYAFDYVYYDTNEPMDGGCLSRLFPNLMVADFCWKIREKVRHKYIVALVQKNKSLKGMIHQFYGGYESLFQYCDELEMVSTSYIEPCIKEKGVKIKQLQLVSHDLNQFKEDAHYFPNLERLHIYNSHGYPDMLYDGPILSRLKIVELSLSSYNGQTIYHGFQFMDSCPNLQSAHICLRTSHIFVDESRKHEALRDLVIEFDDPKVSVSVDWDELKRLLMKYPNLKHLALWSNQNLENEHVEHLVRTLPDLVLLDVRGCPKVTQEAANYVQDYNRLHGQTIKFYFNDNHQEILSDWPHLSTKCEKISQGFDFMKHCFLKGFIILPTFLIPNED